MFRPASIRVLIHTCEGRIRYCFFILRMHAQCSLHPAVSLPLPPPTFSSDLAAPNSRIRRSVRGTVQLTANKDVDKKPFPTCANREGEKMEAQRINPIPCHASVPVRKFPRPCLFALLPELYTMFSKSNRNGSARTSCTGVPTSRIDGRTDRRLDECESAIFD